MTTFALTRTDHPTPADERAAIVAKPVFGANFTDHMALATWTTDEGWHDREIVARRAFELHPGAATFHYGQEIFEGLKAFRQPDGAVAIRGVKPKAERRGIRQYRQKLEVIDGEQPVAQVTEEILAGVLRRIGGAN